MDGKKAKVHKTETVYKGKLFSFLTEDITLPNGARTEMAIVRPSRFNRDCASS